MQKVGKISKLGMGEKLWSNVGAAWIAAETTPREGLA